MARTYHFSAFFSFLLLFSAFFLPFTLPAQRSSRENKIRCASCTRSIPGGRYFVMNGKNYCSHRCVEKAKGKCHGCGRVLTYFFKSPVTGKLYCEVCYRTPRCFFCSSPGGKNKMALISKKMFLCSECKKTAVSHQEKGSLYFIRIRRELKNKLGIGTNHSIRFALASPSLLQKKYSGTLRTGQTGLYEQNVLTRTEKKMDPRSGRILSERTRIVRRTHTIHVLANLPYAEFKHTVAHELTHNWLEEYYPHIKDLKTKEGICEYIAWLFLSGESGKDPAVKNVLTRMENNPDPIYGDGFRMIRKSAGNGNLQTRLARLKNFPGKRR